MKSSDFMALKKDDTVNLRSGEHGAVFFVGEIKLDIRTMRAVYVALPTNDYRLAVEMQSFVLADHRLLEKR